jgi:ABC-type branched-subunit amino acid transport system substrate-binding protein/CHAT domain-containing protein
MNYITMEIRITRGQSLEAGNTYLVSASEIMHRGPVNPAQAMFTLSSDIEERLNQILTESKLRNTQALEEQAARAKSFGIELFNALFQSEVKKLYHELKAKAVSPQSAMRLRLQIVPPELSTLPWELLHDGEQYLCLSGHPKILFARVPTTIVKKRTLSYSPPLRLLGMTACPNGQDKLDVETEKGYINTALDDLIQKKRVEIEWKKAEPSVVRDLRFDDPYHVLHFIGHGYFQDKENKENREGKIIFEDTKGNRLDYDAHRLSLAIHKNIQLVFLNACDTARGDPLDYLSNFAYKLAISGIPAIVAMQFKITDDDAIQFARVFYESIARGEAVDEAVTEARHHIYVGANVSSLQWIAPILYISTSNSISFKVANTVTGTKRTSKGPVLPTPTLVDDLLPVQASSQGQPPTPGQSAEPTQPLEQATTIDDNSSPDQPSNQAQPPTSGQSAELTQSLEQGQPTTSIKQVDSSSLPVPKIPVEPDRVLVEKGIPRRNTFPHWKVIVAVVVIFSLALASIYWYISKMYSPSTASLTTLCLATNLPENGTQAADGRGIRHGVELALQQSSLFTATYHGYHLTEFDMDDSSNGGDPDPVQGAKNLTNLPQETSCPNPIAIVGPYNSSVAQSEIPVAAKSHLLLLSPSNTAPCLTQASYSIPTCSYEQIHPQGFPNTYARVLGTDIDQGYLDADFLVTAPNPANPGQGGLGASRIQIVGDEDTYGTQVSQVVIQALGHKGVTPIGIDCVKSTNDYNKDHLCSQLRPSTDAFSTDNIAALATKIRDEHADAIFFGGLDYQSAALLRKAMGELGLDQVPFVGVGGGFVAETSTFFGLIGSHATNVYDTVPTADLSTFTSGTGTTFFKDYNNKFNEPPKPYSASGYDAANIILQAIKGLIDAGKPVTRENVAQAVLSGNFTGVAGNNIHFDQNGDNIGQRVYTIYQSQQQSQNTWSWKVLTQRTV